MNDKNVNYIILRNVLYDIVASLILETRDWMDELKGCLFGQLVNFESIWRNILHSLIEWLLWILIKTIY